MQVPLFYNHKNTGRPPSAKLRASKYSPKSHFTSKYIDLPWTPLYPFGYGLSYTKFTFSNLSVTEDDQQKDQFIVTAKVTNISKRRGSEVAQLYTHQKSASVTRPVKQLVGFKKVELAPGESKIIKFKLSPYDISFINAKMGRVVESGSLKIMVGDNSTDLISMTTQITTSMAISKNKTFSNETMYGKKAKYSKEFKLDLIQQSYQQDNVRELADSLGLIQVLSMLGYTNIRKPSNPFRATRFPSKAAKRVEKNR